MHLKNKYHIVFYGIVFYLLFFISFGSTPKEINKNDTNVTFRIQIAALSKKYNPDEINKVAKLNEKISIEYDNNRKMYKYLIRNYSTFIEARTFLDSLHSDYKAFIVMYEESERKVEVDMEKYLLTQGIEIDSNQNIIKRPSPAPIVVKKVSPVITNKKTVQKKPTFEELRKPGNFFEKSIFLIKQINTYFLTNISSNYDIEEGEVSDTSYFKFLIYVLFGIIFYCLLSVLVLSLLIFSRRTIQAFVHKKHISFEKKLQSDLIDFLYYDEAYINMPAQLANINSGFKRKILIDDIMQLYSNIIGESSNKLQLLFTDLSLDRYTMKKLKSIWWFVKTRSIHILYKMKIDFNGAVKKISTYLKSNIAILRTEAEVAMVNLNRETPFAFLDDVEKPISDWEQMNLYDTFARNSQSVPDFTKWLSSQNDSVVIFSLRMIRMFKQIDSYTQVLSLLKHHSEYVRYHTILTLGEFRSEDAMKHLAEVFKTEVFKNQLAIIKSIGNLRKPLYADFLKDIIFHSEFRLKLEAAKSISQLGGQGVSELIKIKDNTKDEVIRNILNHALDRRN